MFGRPKRKIQREGDDLKKKLAALEDEASRLHGEIETIQASQIRNPPSSLLAKAGEEMDASSLPGRRHGKKVLPPMRAQYRRKRNQAIILIIFALLLLTWIIAKIWQANPS